MDHAAAIDATRRWISEIVIGLGLCPFARKVFDEGTIHYAVSDATDAETLLVDLARELNALAERPLSERETTVLIHPNVLGDFFDYNDFLGIADETLVELDLDGVVQIASFHPQYQFAESDADAVENYTNRSPYPMLHLLREDSITAIADKPEELAAIPRRNMAYLRKLGLAKVLELTKSATPAKP